MAGQLGYLSFKAASEARNFDEKSRIQQQRNILILIVHYLKDNGLFDSAETILNESQAHHLDLVGFTVCDNMDLSTILLEFECNYLSRLQKKPKFIRELLTDELATGGAKSGRNIAKSKSIIPPVKSNAKKKDKHIQGAVNNTDSNVPGISVQKLTKSDLGGGDIMRDNIHSTHQQLHIVPPISRMASALRDYDNSHCGELRELAQIISKEMYIDNPGVHWDDIKGMEDAKRFVREAVVYPVNYPALFQGILSPWRGLLLAGPPGTGKTMLAKAVATECNTAFFNITASTVVSKWRGESEKLVRVCFDLARRCAPSTIFLDELDALMGQRGENGEHEGSRRMKTEILIQMDGLQRSTDVVFVLAASNLPWELDSAVVRRLEKRTFVGLPDRNARCAMFRAFLPEIIQEHPLSITTELDYDRLAELTDEYSGNDIHLICKEAAMQCVRKVFSFLKEDNNYFDNKGTQFMLEPIKTDDVLAVMQYTKPVGYSQYKAKFLQWRTQMAECPRQL
ncbi:katanin p60 ATPase-containing subunit A-like 2 [Paramacrobiotus metropolitanus]|uniref:katanin p60 ATPase-containing subunit A-like 2 n=1 Tax=Paramacrobiotus metropolitanus TaxID=2943436 RepID=UPI002445AF17|nr:katanin p60 ATPase-containing subunit A-like 2 [Paramacrobiotus metropolitanus]